MFAQEERGFQVNVQLLVPDVLWHGGRISRLGTAHIVHQNVDVPELRDAGVDQLLDLLGFCHVAGLHFGVAAFGADQVASGLRGFQMEIAAIHSGTLARQKHRNGLAIAPAFSQRAATGNQRHFSVESEHLEPHLVAAFELQKLVRLAGGGDREAQAFRNLAHALEPHGNAMR